MEGYQLYLPPVDSISIVDGLQFHPLACSLMLILCLDLGVLQINSIMSYREQDESNREKSV